MISFHITLIVPSQFARITLYPVSKGHLKYIISICIKVRRNMDKIGRSTEWTIPTFICRGCLTQFLKGRVTLGSCVTILLGSVIFSVG